jgi:alanyl aminopeptidase
VFTALAISCGGASSDSTDLIWPPPGGAGAKTVDDGTQGEQVEKAPDPNPPELRLGKDVVPTMYRADLDLDPAKETFSGTIRINVAINNPSDHVWLHANDLTIKSAKITANGESWDLRQLEVENDELVGFHFDRTVPSGEALIDIQYDGLVSSAETSGLFRQDDLDHWYIYTQFEATSARKAFPCFDEPTFKVPWKLSLTVPKDHMALTNTDSDATKTNGATKTVSFEKTKPLPSYLVAIAVGPFEKVSVGKVGRNKVPMNIIVPKGRTSEASYAVGATPAIVEALEEYFDMGLPYDKMDSIAIPRFGGAMENPGLITYSSRIILAEKGNEPAWFKRAYVSVGAHELAHQWFGDLVTLEWWNDIWLNESFATWMAGKVTKQVHPEWAVEVRAVSAYNSAMKADSLATARKLRNPVTTHTDIGGVFDSISYSKGGAVLSMFEQWIGEEAFRDGVRAYMKKHAWGTTTAHDFLAALAGASKPETADAFNTFLTQEGVPLISAELSCEKGKTPSVALSQERFLPTGSSAASDQVWSVPVCVKYEAGQKKTATDCTLLTKKTATLELKKAPRCPSWVLPNAEAAGYYRVNYADGMIEKLFKKGSKHMTVPERVAVIGDMNALVDAGKSDIGSSLSLIAMLIKDKSPHVISAAAKLVAGVDDNVVPENMRKNYARFIRKMFSKQAWRLGLEPKAGESDNEKFLRKTVIELVGVEGVDKTIRKKARAQLTGWLDGKQKVDPDMMETIFTIGALGGDAKLYDRIAKKIEETTDGNEKIALVAALASFTDKKLLEKNLALLLDGKLGLRASVPLIQVPLANPETRQQAYDFIKDNFDAFAEKLSMYAARLIGIAQVWCDQEHYDDAKAFFEPKIDDLPGGDKVLKQTLETIQLCIAHKDAQQPAVTKFLKEF